MGSFSIFHWLLLLIWLGVFVFPLWRIVSKAGFPGALALLSLVPLLNLILLWVFAFVEWPVQKAKASNQPGGPV